MRDLTLDDPLILALVIPVILFAGLVRGFTGFGGPAVIILTLIPFFNPVSIISKVLLIDLVANVTLLKSTSHEVDWHAMHTVCMFSFLGAPLGLYVLDTVDPEIMKRVVASVAALCTILMIIGMRFPRKPPPWANALAGLIAGFTLGATLIAFVIMMYFFASPVSAAISRANGVFWGFAMSGLLVFAHIGLGNILFHDVWQSLLLGLAYLAATVWGARAFRRVSERNFRKGVMWMMLGLSGAGMFL